MSKARMIRRDEHLALAGCTFDPKSPAYLVRLLALLQLPARPTHPRNLSMFILRRSCKHGSRFGEFHSAASIWEGK